MRIVFMSDTHGRHDRFVVPDGDIFVHAGDFCRRGTLEEVREFNDWLAALPHRHKIVIAGNNDWPFVRAPEAARAAVTAARYLQDELVEVEGLRCWGSPWSPKFFNWAFNLPRGEPLARIWRQVPAGVDLLITHTPARGIRDKALLGHVGCEALAAELPRIRPRLHLFGHIHEAYGQESRAGTLHVNGASLDWRSRAVNAAQVLDLS